MIAVHAPVANPGMPAGALGGGPEGFTFHLPIYAIHDGHERLTRRILTTTAFILIPE
jgi:hypothetical protein